MDNTTDPDYISPHAGPSGRLKRKLHGASITWTEDGVERTGVAWERGPRPNTWWVVPVDRRPPFVLLRWLRGEWEPVDAMTRRQVQAEVRRFERHWAPRSMAHNYIAYRETT